MKRIIVAVDGSDAALHAARKALDLARATQGTVTLVHVVAQAFLPTEAPFVAGQVTEDIIKIGELMLEQVAQKLGAPDLRRVCLTGPAAEMLVDFAETENADLVVVGSKGRGAVSRVLVGSTTDRIVHISRRPVLVVR